MYKLCKTEQSTQRQHALEQGLLTMMLQQRYEDISVSDLCEYMQIPRKSFYRYFSSKDGALFALLDHSMMGFFNTGGGSVGLAPSNQAGELERYFIFWRDHRSLLDALQRSGLSGILVERAMNLARRERMMPKYVLTWPEEEQQLALSFAVCGLLSMVIQWHSQDFHTPPTEMTRVALSILTKPLIR